MRSNVLRLSMVALYACGHPEVELSGDQLARYDGDGPTWNEIYPIMQNNCVTCHRAGQLGTYKPFDTYDWVIGVADKIALRVQGPSDQGEPQMPPYTPDATETCIPAHGYSNDLDLTEQEISDIVAWVEEGVPHGDNAEIPEPLIPPAVATLTGATEYTFTEGTPISIVDTSMYDVFACIIYDPGISERARRLSGIQINPGVDHLYKGARIMLDRGRESLQYVADDSPRTHGASWYDCTDGFGFEGELLTTFLAGTYPPTDGSEAPGGIVVPPLELPPGSAMSVPGDALFVARLLYHPHWAHLDPTDTTEITEELSWVDTTSLSLRWETRGLNLALASMVHFGNDTVLKDDGTGLLTEPFEVPRGDRILGSVPHVEIMAATIPGKPTDTYEVWGVVPSLGRSGSTIEVKSTPADGGPEQCLAAIADWDVSFQSPALYSADFEGGPVVHGGDTVTATCTYENKGTEPLYLDAGPAQERCEATLGLLKLKDAPVLNPNFGR